MAVVKSPKNTKRKQLWKRLLTQKQKYLKNNQTQLTSNTYKQSVFRKKKNLTTRNAVLIL